MKTKYVRYLVLFALSSLLAAFARADAAAYSQVLKERDAVLSQILALRESRLASGVGDDSAVLAARIALWSFRRDTASSKQEKIKQQEYIVRAHEKRLSVLKGRVAVGVDGDDNVLFATDELLQAKQLLEELRLDERAGLTRRSP
jgi:hypothetical protein